MLQAYQNSASFVPKLATKVIGWLDVREDDVILDVGCGGECCLAYLHSTHFMRSL